METEIWKPVVGYEGLYEVSNTGSIKSIKYMRKGGIIILKQNITNCGYKGVSLSKNKCISYKTVHRLVAGSFLENIDNKPCVNHKNGIKHDNRVENLEWCTYSENIIHSYNLLGRKSNLIGKKVWKGMYGKLNPFGMKVKQYDKDMNFIKEWDCIRDVERELGINKSGISLCCNGKRKTAGGYIWKFNK